MADRVDVERLRALYEKATPGPWHSPAPNVFRLYTWVGQTPVHCIISDALDEAYWGMDQVPGPDAPQAAANVQLIAALHNALPAILAELERGRRIEVALVKAMDTLNDFGAYARMCGRPPLANAARIAVAASLAALEQENGDG